MNIHILGACGTFMAGIAQIAKHLGHEVVAVDQDVYPPMSDLLLESGIELCEGYENYEQLSVADLVVIGNALS